MNILLILLSIIPLQVDDAKSQKDLIKQLLRNSESDKAAVLRVLNKYAYTKNVDEVHTATTHLGNPIYTKKYSKTANPKILAEVNRIKSFDKWQYRPYLTDNIKDNHLIILSPRTEIVGPSEDGGIILRVPVYDINKKKTDSITCVAYGLSFSDIDEINVDVIITGAIFSKDSLYAHTTVTSGKILKVADGKVFIAKGKTSVKDEHGSVYVDIPILLEFSPPTNLLQQVMKELH